MGLAKPVAVYNAANNIEAHLVCSLLQDRGFEAYVTRDESVVGLSAFGPLPEIHKPQVWVADADRDAVASILTEFESDRRGRGAAATANQDADSTIAVVCEDCGKKSLFAVSQCGSVQTCNHCRAYVDVEDESDAGVDEDYGEPE